MSAQPESLPPLPEPAGVVGRYLINDRHSQWFFAPESAAWTWGRSEQAKLRGAEATEEVYTADQMRAYARAVIEPCAVYLKEGETPAQRIERDHRDSLALMRLLAQEKHKSEALLEVLQRIVQWDESGCYFQTEDTISQARAAIAKAEGR